MRVYRVCIESENQLSKSMCVGYTSTNIIETVEPVIFLPSLSDAHIHIMFKAEISNL